MPPTFLLRDDFTTDAAAPLTSPRTADPGPGTLTLVQVDGQFSVSAGKMSFVAQGTPTWTNQGLYESGGRSRVAGRALFATLNYSTRSFSLLSWRTVAGVDLTPEVAFYVNGSTSIDLKNSATNWLISPIMSGSVNIQLALILRATGAFAFIKGDTYTQWTMLWVDAAAATPTLYPVFVNRLAAGTLDTLRVLDLPAPYATDFGLATQRLAGARAAGDTFTHEANCVIEWTQTTIPTSAQTQMYFRQQDTSNRWLVQVENTGTNSLTLYEVVAGVPTQRGSSVGVMSAGHRVVIVADGATIRVYSNNVLRITYSSATNFQTATVGRLNALGGNGAVSDIVTWPRQITGVPASILDAAVGGSGDLTATLAAATLTATGQVGPVPITGQLTVTLAPATLVSTGQVRIAGQLAVTLAAATLVAAGQGPQAVHAQLAVVLMAATLTATNVRVAIELGTVYGQADTATIYGQQVYGEVIGI